MPQCRNVYGGVYFCMQWIYARLWCSLACARNPFLNAPVDGGAVCVAPCGPAVCVKGSGGERGEESAVARGPQPP